MTQRLKFAFYGRVSTEDNQDPTLSLPRQLTNCERAVTGIDGEIVAHFYDVESGAGRFDERGTGKGLIGFDIPIPRGGGLPDLLELATLGGINAVVCESISRVSRNPSVTFRVEEDLRSHDVKLWAADEPWEESFGSIVLRHVNVGVARGYLHELKVKSRQGLEAACRQGRHIGGIPLYGYRFKEVVHPNPHRAKQGRRMRILEPDPPLASVVRTIFEWYVVHDFSLREITKRLNSDLDRYPSPIPPDPTRAAGSWSRSSVWEILHNPKYTGYQVWNRRGKKRGNRLNDSELWIWSDELAHEPLVSRDTFDKASTKGSSNDNAGRSAVSVEQSRKPFLLRSFVRCGICGLRLQGHRNRGSQYYACEANRRSPSLLEADHPRTVYLQESKAVEKVVEFLNTHVFGKDRLRRLEDILDANDPQADIVQEEIVKLRSEVAEIDSKIRRQLAHLDAEEADSQAAAPLRDRLRELAALKAKREHQLKAEQRAMDDRPSPNSAAALLEHLPLMEVDVVEMGEEAVRELLKVLDLKGAYDQRDKILTLEVRLVPELIGPDGLFTRVLSVPPTGFEPVFPP